MATNFSQERTSHHGASSGRFFILTSYLSLVVVAADSQDVVVEPL